MYLHVSMLYRGINSAIRYVGFAYQHETFIPVAKALLPSIARWLHYPQSSWQYQLVTSLHSWLYKLTTHPIVSLRSCLQSPPHPCHSIKTQYLLHEILKKQIDTRKFFGHSQKTELIWRIFILKIVSAKSSQKGI